jgi:MoxR-like ATPase
LKKQITLPKKPHKIIQQFWDERHQQLTSFIEQQLKNMDDNRPIEIDMLERNLFVDAEFASIVRQNFEEVAANLRQLHLALEKLQFSYTNI